FVRGVSHAQRAEQALVPGAAPSGGVATLASQAASQSCPPLTHPRCARPGDRLRSADAAGRATTSLRLLPQGDAAFGQGRCDSFRSRGRSGVSPGALSAITAGGCRAAADNGGGDCPDV